MINRYECIPLLSKIEHYYQINSFKIDRENAYSTLQDKIIGLESYLKRCAWQDDSSNLVRIYLIKDVLLNEIAAYFGLKAGMLCDSQQGMIPTKEQTEILQRTGMKWLPEVIPGIEISHFAVNDNYRRSLLKTGISVRGLGKYFYPAFIYPIIEDVTHRIGVNMIYLYAAGDKKLISYYQDVFDFHVLSNNDYYVPLMPDYDGGCKFMYKII